MSKRFIVRFLIAIVMFLSFALASILRAQCPGDFCSDAIDIGCEPYFFNNTNCSDENICIQPNVGNTNCLLNLQTNSQNFTWTVTQEGYYVMTIEADLISTSVPAYNYCYGPDYLQGAHWALGAGTCDNIQWLSTWINPANCNRCRCFSGNTVTWVGDCDEVAPCSNPVPMQPQWNNNCPLVLNPGLPYAYNVCVQDWQVVFYLTPGTYHLIIYGFMGAIGDGSVSICPETPLCNPPSLSVSGNMLSWTEGGDGPYTVWVVTDLTSSEWQVSSVEEGRSVEVSVGGAYKVTSSCGQSQFKMVHIEQMATDKRSQFDYLGREYSSKFYINHGKY